MRHRTEKKKPDFLTALPFILPAFIFTFTFFIVPAFKLFYMSFFEWPLIGESFFTGLYNYKELLSDPDFWQAFRFTLEYSVQVTPFLFILAFVYALLVNRGIPGTNVFRSIYFSPVVISMVAACLLWMWLFNDLNGMVNHVLQSLGLIQKPVSWLAQKSTSLPIVSLTIVWKMTGFTMMIFVANMQAVPDEYYEVAAIYGSKPHQTLIHITIPLLRNAIIMALILSLTGSILAFDQFRIMTYGGPINSTRTFMMYVYDVGFQYGRLGSAAAMSVFLCLFLAVISLFQLWLIKKK